MKAAATLCSENPRAKLMHALEIQANSRGRRFKLGLDAVRDRLCARVHDRTPVARPRIVAAAVVDKHVVVGAALHLVRHNVPAHQGPADCVSAGTSRYGHLQNHARLQSGQPRTRLSKHVLHKLTLAA